MIQSRLNHNNSAKTELTQERYFRSESSAGAMRVGTAVALRYDGLDAADADGP